LDYDRESADDFAKLFYFDKRWNSNWSGSVITEIINCQFRDTLALDVFKWERKKRMILYEALVETVMTVTKRD
jgi:hypothetical protein